MIYRIEFDLADPDTIRSNHPLGTAIQNLFFQMMQAGGEVKLWREGRTDDPQWSLPDA
jgi:hypothetical protein